MAKELWIVFVYDTQRCTAEEDDPQDAVLYFHPAWVNDQHRLALCGQIMGTAQFFLTTFSCPRLLALDSGKFLLCRCGRYFLVVGTDRNIPDWVLEHRAVTLWDMVQFYHGDLETVVRAAGPAAKERLAHVFDSYLPTLQHASNLLGVVPSVRLPKSAGNVFLEAMQLLQACQQVEGVLAGAVFYENRVVATQLSSALTKRLVATDPHHIKVAADAVHTQFHLPVGVQLLTVYLEGKEFARMSQECVSRKLAVEDTMMKRLVHSKLPQTPKEAAPAMKKDTSRIFTVVEDKEEEADESPWLHHGADVVLHDEVVSICRPADDACRPADDAYLIREAGASINGEPRDSHEVVLDLEEGKARSRSLVDVRHPLRAVPMRCYSLGLPKPTRGMCQEDGLGSETPSRHVYNTITDPSFPVFRSDGLSVSRALFDEYLERHYKLLGLEEPAPPPGPESRPRPQDVYRRSLSLPLKAITVDEADDGVDIRRRSTSYTSDCESPAVCKAGRALGSLQLTPLVSRLSLLAEDSTSGFCSSDSTPSEPRPPPHARVGCSHKPQCPQEDRGGGEGEPGRPPPHRMVLYVYGQQDTVLLALLEEQSALDPQLIHSLWEVCTGQLGVLDAQLHKCLDHFPQGECVDSYSFMILDPCWDVLHRGGDWNSAHLDVVACLHRDLSCWPMLTEVILRSRSRAPRKGGDSSRSGDGWSGNSSGPGWRRQAASANIQDARFLIIQKKRQKLTDARDQLAQLARHSDLRSKLDRIRGGSRKDLMRPREYFGSITKQMALNGELTLKTNKRPRFLTFTPSKGGTGQSIRRTVWNDPLVPPDVSWSGSYGSPRPPARRAVHDDSLPPRGTALFLSGDLVRPSVKHTFDDMAFPSYQAPVAPQSRHGWSGHASARRRGDTPVVHQAAAASVRLLSQREEWARRNPAKRRRDSSVIPSVEINDSDSDDAGLNGMAAPSRVSSELKARLDSGARLGSLPVAAKPGHRIVVSNLHPTVIHEDIRELFEDVGTLLDSRLVRPGTAEVVYQDLQDAVKAVDLYHNRHLDGQPMKCLLVNSSMLASKPAPSGGGGARTGGLAQLKLPAGTKSSIVPDVLTIHKALFNKS